MDKILSENRTLKDMFKFFKKGRGECNTKEEMAIRLLKYCKEAYNPEAEVPLEMEAPEDPRTIGSPAMDEEKINNITETEVEEALKKCSSRAKGVDGYSQADLRALSKELIPILLVLFNNSLASGKFPKQFLKNHNIFLYKKGDKDDPKNYRAIAIQNPVLKVFCKILHNRLVFQLDKELPETQFGFRQQRSTQSACYTLREIISQRLKAHKKTPVLFVDFQKAFPSVNRQLLFDMLKKKNINPKLIQLIGNIYRDTTIAVMFNDGFLKETYSTSCGLPEGCCLSPLFFAVFISDFDTIAEGRGVEFEDEAGKKKKIFYLAFADDIGLISKDSEEMESILKSLESYCQRKKLVINVPKTKILTFGKGRPVKPTSYYLNNKIVEEVKHFKYLGVKFTVGLSFTEHLLEKAVKAKGRIGYLFNKLNIRRLSLELALRIFHCYITPIFTYGLACYWGAVSKNAVSALDSCFTKYIKRWLGIPYSSLNALVYHYSNTMEMSVWFNEAVYENQWEKLQLPHLRNMQIKRENFRGLSTPNIRQIPSYMWANQVSFNPPMNPVYRMRMARKLFGWTHMEWCDNETFHSPYLPLSKDTTGYDYLHNRNKTEVRYCRCRHCGERMSWLHEKFCEG